MTPENDVHLPLLPTEADALVRRLTNGRMRIQTGSHGIFLTHVEKRSEVHLAPYQLTALNLERVVAENNPG